MKIASWLELSLDRTHCTKLFRHGLTSAIVAAYRVLTATRAKPDAGFGSTAAIDGTASDCSAARCSSIFQEGLVRLSFTGQPLVMSFQTAECY
jgi:hypothetical protein